MHHQPSPGPSTPILPPQQPNPAEQSSSKPRGDDYVYFERTTTGFTSDAVARSTAAKLKLESYYKVAVDTAIERNARYVVYPYSRAPTAYTRLVVSSWKPD